MISEIQEQRLREDVDATITEVVELINSGDKEKILGRIVMLSNDVQEGKIEAGIQVALLGMLEEIQDA